MSQLWRVSVVTGAGLFLETCAFYLIIKMISGALHQSEAVFPFWLVFVALLCSFLVSTYVQTFKFTPNLRGSLGLGISVLALLGMSHLKMGLGLIPVGAFLNSDLDTIFRQVLVFAFLVILWWRGGSIAHDDVTLDTVRSSFQWGMVVVFGAVLIHSLSSASLVSGFLIVGFFGVGLAGLALARFSSEAGDSQNMALDWWAPIVVSVAVVLLLGLLISAAGLGGLDDVTRALLKIIGNIGFWVLKPILLGLGYLAGLLVAVGNWISSMFGGGDLSGLERAQEQIRQFHENMQNQTGEKGFPSVLAALAKFLAFVVSVSLAGWLLHRIYRFRRLLRSAGEVEETRESVFSWTRANQDLASFVGDWWDKLVAVGGAGPKKAPEPQNPREFYHALLALAARLGRPRQEWQTPKEHQGTLLGLFPGEPVSRIVDGFELAYYGGSQAEERDIERLRYDWVAINDFVEEQTPEQ